MIEVTVLELAGDAPGLELLQAGRGSTLQDLRERARARSAEFGPDCRVSRSYAFPYALLAHHDEPVGVDVELVQPCDVVFAASICTPEELESVRVLDWSQVTSLWSSKEALAKALGDARLYDPRRLGGPAGWEDGTSGPWRARPIQIADGYRAWVCWRAGVGSATATRATLPGRHATAGG